MSLKAGDPADESDVWLRVVTNENYWKADGTLHNKAFGGGAFSPSKDLPWRHELSGRLLSLIKNLEQECIDFCGQKFAGVMFQTVVNLRSKGSGFSTDVYYTPTERDEAHSDFVIFGIEDKDDIFQVRDWLQDFVQYVKPQRLAAVEALRRK
jgi:hypothetical protein